MVTFLTFLLIWVWYPQWTFVVAQGNTACVGSDLDWYIKAVGETPCKTYERLRQTCDSNYRVGVLNVNTPPDLCDSQIGDCCCNSIAFSLSMLCLNCQQDNNSTNGIDAGAGAYQIYLSAAPSFCPVTNQSLPQNIQAATCNEGLKIMDGLYSLFWGTGDWFYTFVRESLTTAYNMNNGSVFTHCSASNSTTTASSSTSATTLPPTNTFSTTSASFSSQGTTTSIQTQVTGAFSAPDSVAGASTTGADPSTTLKAGNLTASHKKAISSGGIAGLVVGLMFVLAFVALIGFMYYKRRREKQQLTLSPFENFHAARPVSSAYSNYNANYNYPQGAWSSAPSSQSAPSVMPYPYGHVREESTSDVHGYGTGAPLRPAPPTGGLYDPMSARHTDAGPLQPVRASGRLPPAYDRDWEERQ